MFPRGLFARSASDALHRSIPRRVRRLHCGLERRRAQRHGSKVNSARNCETVGASRLVTCASIILASSPFDGSARRSSLASEFLETFLKETGVWTTASAVSREIFVNMTAPRISAIFGCSGSFTLARWRLSQRGTRSRKVAAVRRQVLGPAATGSGLFACDLQELAAASIRRRRQARRDYGDYGDTPWFTFLCSSHRAPDIPIRYWCACRDPRRNSLFEDNLPFLSVPSCYPCRFSVASSRAFSHAARVVSSESRS